MYLYLTKGQAVSGGAGIAAGYLVGKRFKRPFLGAIAGAVAGWFVGQRVGMPDILWSTTIGEK